MRISREWRGIWILVIKIEVVAQIRAVMRREVWMSVFQAIIEDREMYAEARREIPSRFEVCVYSGRATLLSDILHMPFLPEKRVIWHEPLALLPRKLGLSRKHTWLASKHR